MSARGFGRSVAGVWMVFGRFVEGYREVLGSLWKVSGMSLVGVRKVTGRCLEGVW